MSVERFEVFARSTAPPEAVWRWLADASSWKEWTKLTTAELERDGAPDPDGVGAIRRLGRAGRVSREEVLVFDAPTHLAYTILSGVPVKNYRADVHLTPDGDGTLIAWRASFEPTRSRDGPGHPGLLHLLPPRRRPTTREKSGPISRIGCCSELGGA